MVTTVYLVRHGETNSNIERKFQGQRNIPLNENGRRQGDLLGQAMKDYDIDEVFTSRLARANETGELIAKYHEAVPVTIVPGLEEVDVGDIAGEYIDEVEKQMPELFHCMTKDQVHLQYPNGESSRDVYDRMVKAVSGIVESNRGRSIVIVSHGFSIQTYLHFASGRPFEELKEYIVANTSQSKFTYEDGSVIPQTVYINKHDHLPSDGFTEWKFKEEE